MGPEGAKQPHLILLQVKLDYMPDILPKPDVRRNSRLGSRGAQNGQSRLFFAFFFYFSNITAKLFILEENFCIFKF